MLNHKIHEKVESLWQADINSKSSTKHINSKALIVGKCHHIWSTIYGDSDMKTKFQTLRQQIKKKIKDSYQAYLENLLGPNDEDSKCDSKKLFSFLKNSRCDQQGIPPLKHDNILYSDTKTKANLFNQQFNSVFTPKEPLSLSRLASMRVQDLKKAGGLPSDTTPDSLQDSATNMPEINISENGLMKLLQNLKPGKAAGPDKLKPLLLRELREEIHDHTNYF